MSQRAKLMTETFNGMDNVTSNEIEGAMYAFPNVAFSQKAINAASK